MKHTPILIVTTLACLLPVTLKATDHDTANNLYADPYGHLDKTVTVRVLSVRPEHFESLVRDVVWFKAETVTHGLRNSQTYWKNGGEIMVAVDASKGNDFYRTFGPKKYSNDQTLPPTHTLSGDFRAFDKLLKADPNKRRVDELNINNGHYFIDLTTDSQFTNVPLTTGSQTASTSGTSSSSDGSSSSSGDSKSFFSVKSLMHQLGYK